MLVTEEYHEAVQELKRADHSIFATLKYTRSCDVVLNVIERFCRTYDSGIRAVLQKDQEEGKFEEIPQDNKSRVLLFRKLYPQFGEHMDRFNLFRRIVSSDEMRCEEEFRKNLTLVVNLAGEEHRLNVEQIEIYYSEMKQFVKELGTILRGDGDELGE